ncbi:MAG TPA: hypothetical protein VFL54_09950 [Gammaproteobacteria bacterium]|nr:hypothetical protein [Gammaproteobacteria bacterium]
MSVRIPISADPAGTVAAFGQITNAIRRAGQEGRRFEQLDFSHPELKDFEKDLRAAQRNFEELRKVGRGQTASAVRAGQYTDVLDWYNRHGRQFPEKSARLKHRATVGSYVLQDTRYEINEPVAAGRGGGGGLGGLPIPGVGRFIKGALALAGIGGLASLANQGVQQAQDEAINLDLFKRSINDTDDSFDQLRTRIEQAGRGLQLTYNETVKLAQGFARASALQSGAAIAQGVGLSAGFGRSFGLEPGMSGGIFGAMRFRGVTGPGGAMDPKQFALMLADSISSSGMFAKSAEVMQAIASYVTTSERVMVNAPNVAGYTDLLTRMNIAGQHGMPGLRGQMGAALIAQVDSAIRAGGRMGPAGRNILWRAINAHGAQLNPFQTDFLLAGGAFATRSAAFKGVAPGLAHGNKTVLDSFLDEMRGRMAGRGQFALYEGVSNVLGIGVRQARALLELQHSGGGLGGIGKLLKTAGLDYKDLNATGLKELGQIAYASPGELQDLKKQSLGRADLTDEERAAITGAKKPEELKAALATAAARHGRITNQGTRTLDSLTAIKNAVTKLGQDLLDPVNDIRTLVARMAGSVTGENPATDAWNAAFGEGARQKKAEAALKGAAKEAGKDIFHTMLSTLLPDSTMAKYEQWKSNQGMNHPIPQGASSGGKAVAGGKFDFNHHITLYDQSGAVKGTINRQMSVEAPVADHG